MEETTFADNDYVLVLFSKKTRFHWRRRQSFKKICYSWGRTKWYWYIWQWKTWIYLKKMNLPKQVLIDEECGNL